MEQNERQLAQILQKIPMSFLGIKIGKETVLYIILWNFVYNNDIVVIMEHAFKSQEVYIKYLWIKYNVYNLLCNCCFKKRICMGIYLQKRVKTNVAKCQLLNLGNECSLYVNFAPNFFMIKSLGKQYKARAGTDK